MSNLKSRPPGKPKQDLDDFLSGAESDRKNKSTTKQPQESHPWDEPGIRDDVMKLFNLRMPEPYLLKLKYIAEHTPDSMQKFCWHAVQEAIDAKIEELTK
ncbi:MAG: hypothetical protein ACXWTP_00200 [Methylosarcina sp.]